MKTVRTIAVFVALLTVFSLASCAGGGRKAVMKIGGFEISRDLYSFAVVSERESVRAKYGEDVFAGDVPDEIAAELREGVLSYLRDLCAILSLGRDHNISLTDPVIENDVNTRRISDENEVGGRDEFLSVLAEAGMTEEVYRFVTGVSVISDELYYAMLNSGEINDDPAFVRSFIEGDGCVRIKQILVTRESRTDGRARELAEEAMSRAAAGEDFDALISQYNEDMRMFSNSQGYYLMKGVWFREFEEAAFALAVGGVSDVVETPSGYSVIKRYEKDPGYISSHFDELADDYYDSVFSLAREKRAGELEITDSAEYEKLDILKIGTD